MKNCNSWSGYCVVNGFVLANRPTFRADSSLKTIGKLRDSVIIAIRAQLKHGSHLNALMNDSAFV